MQIHVAHKQHVILFEQMEIIASAELSDHSDPDTCHIYKGPDVSSEQPIPEIKAVGLKAKARQQNNNQEC